MGDDCDNVITINTAELVSAFALPPSALIVSPMKDTMFRMKLFGRRKADLW
jgi:hypothetical protein